MALSKEVLGQDLMDATAAFNNKTNDELVATYGSLEAARLAAFKAQANAIINHFKTAGVLSIPGTGLIAGSTPVTGTSITGTLT